MRCFTALAVLAVSTLIAAPAFAETRNELAQLLAPDGESGDEFGFAVAADGDTAIVGARNENQLAFSSGAAYVFVREGETWTFQQKLVALDGSEAEWFGWSVGISGDTAIVGCPYDNADEQTANAGAAYVFVRDAGTWTQQAKLVAPVRDYADFFGVSVAVDVDTAVVGMYGDDEFGRDTGAAFVYVRDTGIWTLQDKLVAGDPAENDFLGWSVGVSGDTAIVGSPFDDEPEYGNTCGSAYIFVRDALTWSEQQKIYADDADWGDEFGTSVSISGETALVGAYKAEQSAPSSGSAYVFTRSGGTWTQQAELVPDDGAFGDNLGYSVSVSGDAAIVGAHQDDDHGTSSGSAYLFTRSGDNWTQSAKLLCSSGAEQDRFGNAVGVGNGTIVIGAYLDDDRANQAGAAYIFSAGDVPCPADTTGNGTVDFGDILAILSAWGPCGGCPEDIDGDGFVAFSDILAVLSGWGPC